MRSIQTEVRFPLSSVKPLEAVANYRATCISQTREALRSSTQRRDRSPVSGARLEPLGKVDGILYMRCPETQSIFLAELPPSDVWAKLLASVSRLRHSPETFHQDLSISREDNVYAPKVEWVLETLALQGMHRPRLLEVGTPPSDLSRLLKESDGFSDLRWSDEMVLAHAREETATQQPRVDAVTLLESLDRVDDPVGLLQAVRSRLVEAGLLFVTALVSSGFDFSVLGIQNKYLYPPDRTNCFSLVGLRQLLEGAGFTLVEVSTPGVLDVEIVQAHLQDNPAISLSGFERQILSAGKKTRSALQAFLQEQGFSSFARIVARKKG